MAKESKPPSPFEGRWRITSMKMWSQAVVDAEVEGFVEFGPNGSGSFQFAYVSGDIDYLDSIRDGMPGVEWSWNGNDEMDPASGRGWAVIDGDKIHGDIAIHHADQSEFEAIRKVESTEKKKPIKPVRKPKILTDDALALSKYATLAYIDADERGIKKKTIEKFPLDGNERAILAALPVLPAFLKKKLERRAVLEVVDVITLVVVISESLVEEESGQHPTLLMISRKLMDCLQENVTSLLSPKPKPVPKPPSKDEKDEALDVIIGLIDQFCKEHLNEEYAELCRRLTEKLARKRPSPLVSGKPQTWACGIVRTIGWVNFLDDSSQKPHMKLTAIDKAFGVGESTGQGKSMLIRRMFKIRPMDPAWSLCSRIKKNSMAWMIQFRGFLVDARILKPEFQEEALRQGLIPYIPERPKSVQGDDEE